MATTALLLRQCVRSSNANRFQSINYFQKRKLKSSVSFADGNRTSSAIIIRRSLSCMLSSKNGDNCKNVIGNSRGCSFVHSSSGNNNNNDSPNDDDNDNRKRVGKKKVASSSSGVLDKKTKKKTTTTFPLSTYVTALSELSKLRLSALVVSTTSAGFLAAGGPISYGTLACVSLGTALCSSSASTFNQVFEIDRDALMKRTRNRPLVQGVYSARQATLLGLGTGSLGGTLLYVGTDPVTTALGVGNIALYAGLYTYLKPRSEWNTWVGAVVGAVPPVMGWTAATGGQLWDVEALLLGATLYLWQFPHFFALSWMHRVDYGRGGFRMVPVVDNDPHGDRTSSLITRYACYLAAVPCVAALTDVTSSMFAVEGVVLNAYALSVARRFHHDRTNAHARTIFLTSLWYLPCLLTLFLLHSKTWREETVEHDDRGTRFLKQQIRRVTDTGKELCVHEQAKSDITAHATNNKDRKCPVGFGYSKARTATAAVNDGVQHVASNIEDNKHRRL